MSADDTPAPPLPGAYAPDEIVLYGGKLNQGNTGQIGFATASGSFVLQMELLAGDGTALPQAQNPVMAVVYGYSYEGHCYRLDRPKLLAFTGIADQPARGCGFDAPDAPGEYRMWRIRRSTELFELGGVAGRAEDVILQANAPGRRSPASYAIHMQLAHRGGRFTMPGDSS